jgi:hypothetical protein
MLSFSDIHYTQISFVFWCRPSSSQFRPSYIHTDYISKEKNFDAEHDQQEKLLTMQHNGATQNP